MPPRQPGTLIGGAWQLTLLVLTTAPVGSTGAELLPSSGANPPPNPVLSTTPPSPNESKPTPNFSWRGEWKGWEGFHFDLTRRTLLGELAPSVTNLPPVIPHLWSSEPGSPRTYQPNLAQARMAGKIGVKFALDAATYGHDSGLDDIDSGAEVRRARLYAKGDCLLVWPVSYELEMGYIPNEFYIESSYLQFKNLGLPGTLKTGQYHVPMTLENVGSSRDMMFMESAAPLQALGPGVEAGFQLGRPILQRRMTWAFGLFTDGVGDDFGDATEDFGRAVVRITGLPIDNPAPEGSQVPHPQNLLHLGVSAYGLYAGANAVRYRTRPESHLAPYLIDTGSIESDGAIVVGGEAAWVDGPVSVQGEFMHAWVRTESNQEVDFHGLYGSASWFLTGESRPYDRDQGIFSRVKPNRGLAPSQGGWGAWEIAGRVSHVNLNSEGVSGGRLTMGMAGLNWFLYSHLKWRLDYGVGHLSGGSRTGTLRLLQSRIEIDF